MVETYKNTYGENWWFMFDTNRKIGLLQGDDDLIVGKTFYVINGQCPQLILDKDEILWLKNIWDKYSITPTKNI